ncbi:MAG: putative S-layer protein [archaeon]
MNKKLNFLVSILAIVLLANFVTAATSFSISPTTLTFTNSNTQTFTITNTNSSELLSVILSPSPFTMTVDGQSVTFSFTGNLTDINSTSTITIAPVTPIDFSRLDLGDAFSKNLVITDSSNSSESVTVAVRIEDSQFCEFSDNGNLEMQIDSINAKGFAEEDDEWYPLDEIEVDIDLDNRGSEDIRNIEIEWVLLTSDGKEVMDGDLADFNLKDGNDDTKTFTFKVDPNDLEEGVEDYVLYVRATGEDKEFDSNETCVSDSQDVKIVLESDFVVIDQDSLEMPESLSCGGNLIISADVWNIGEDDQDEVSVRIYNSELGIDEIVEVGDIDAFDKEPLDISIKLPDDAAAKSYNIKFDVLDEDGDVYENDNDDKSSFTVSLTLGNCGASIDQGQGVSISASLQSEAKAGEQLVIKATLRNTGDEDTTYTVFVTGNEDWSNLDKIEPQTLQISSGESETVMIYLDVDDDVTGEQTFKLKAVFGSETKEQTVSVNIEGAGAGTGGALTGFSVADNIRENWFIWTIVLVNIILIILIIVVATRIAKG